MHPLLQRIQKGESETLDFKKIVPGASKIAKTIVSMANHRGGSLLIGVNDNGSISGVRSLEERYVLETAAHFFCKPEIEVEFIDWNLNGKHVLEIKIPEGLEKPYFAKDEEGKWWAYVRVKDQSLLASKVMLDVMKRGNSAKGSLIEFTSKEKALLDYLNEHNRITLAQYCKMLNLSRWRAQKILVNLVSTGVIRVHHIENPEFYTL